MSEGLRQHMQELHPRVQRPRGEKQLERQHAEQHYRYSPNHVHEGVNRGPGERPPGWKTGEGPVPKK